MLFSEENGVDFSICIYYIVKKEVFDHGTERKHH